MTSPEALTAQLEQSLVSLQAPAVDLFYLHAPDANVQAEDALAAVQRLYEGALPRVCVWWSRAACRR